ncbi:MAG TPA: RsmG family class I SAM-dependent methyltransferase [Acidimicrobiia bacterium]|nr:RsmG family class I SAM-dependent methyltransferase [Acidimicrobiia bacterium]
MAEVRARLAGFRTWLISEAIPSGGIGPGEATRLDARHMADSLLFAGVWDTSSLAPVVDVGTGVGLPGIPLAIIAPDRPFVLVDRSARRVELARRAVRVLGLENVEVRRADVVGFDWRNTTVVSRAALTPARLLALVQAQGAPKEMLVADSHLTPRQVAGFDSVEIPAEILDRAVWILRMVPS